MSFAHPSVLYLAALAVPALGLFFWWSWQVRRRLIARFVPRRLQESLALGLSPRRARLRAVLWVAAVFSLLLALARPQGGSTSIEVTQRGLDILVAIDTSRSMLAEDAGPGISRLQAARLAALDLARLAKRDRLGLIAFAGGAFLQCPLTVDDQAFAQGVDALDTEIIPEGGTALGPAIDAALEATRGQDNVPVLVLFTDGEEHEPGAVAAADRAAKAGLRIFTVGVGTARGEIVRLRGASGEASYLKDSSGNVVKSSLNEPLLREIAEKTDGYYLPLQGPHAMSELFARRLEPLPRRDIASRLLEQRQELFQWPLAIALLLLAIEILLPEHGRARGATRPVRQAHPTLAGAVAVVALALLVFPARSMASTASAYRNYHDGEYAAALAEYERLAREAPDDARLRFNAGTAAYRAREFPKAAEHFSGALRSRDLRLQQRAYYNLGNARFSEGESIPDPKARAQAWEQSIRSYESALALNPADQDARHNLDLARKRLEELRQQQQQQQNQQDQKPSDDSQPQQDGDPDRDSSSEDEQPPQSGDQPQQDNDQARKPQEPQDAQSAESPDNSRQPSGDENQGQQDSERGDGGNAGESKDASASRGEEPNEPQAGGAREGDADQQPGMTPQQALRLLDVARGEEKPISPPKRKGRTRTVKDW